MQIIGEEWSGYDSVMKIVVSSRYDSVMQIVGNEWT